METSVVVEEAHQRTDSTPLSKSSGLVMIDSISIDLGSVMDNQHGETNCKHFSIRGYAAEIRKKDLSICYPFAFDSKPDKLEEQASILSPLHVVEYKWWGCESCIRKIDATVTKDEAGMFLDNRESGFASTSNCPNLQSSSHPAKVLPDSLPALKVDSFAINKTDANGSTSVGTNEIHFSSHTYVKEKKDDFRSPITVGHGDGLGKGVIEKYRHPTGDLSKSASCLLQERNADAPDALGLQTNGLVDSCRPNHKTVADFRSLKPMGQKSAEICQLRIPTSPDCDQRIVPMAPETSKVADTAKPSGNIGKGKMISCSSFSPEKHDNLSSESDEMLARNGNHDLQPNLIIPISQKAPKVRLLTELLGPERIMENDRITEVGGSSSSMPVISSGLEIVPSPCNDMAVQGSPRKRLGAPKGKRKMPQDKEWKPVDFMYPRKPTKKARRFKGDTDTTNTSDENPESLSSEDVSARLEMQTSILNKYTPHMGNRNSMVSKKKKKQDQLEGGYYPSMPEQAVAQKKNNLSSGVAADSFFRSANDAFINSRMKSNFGSTFSAKDGERKSNFGKMRNKHVGSRHGCLTPHRNSLPGQGSILRESTDIMEFERETVKRQSAHETAARNFLEMSRNGYANAQRNEKNFTSQKGDAVDLLSPQQKGTPRTDHKRKGLLCDLNENVSHGVSTLSGMKNSVPRFENGSFYHHQHSDISDSRNSQKTSEVQDQGLDDIPMEIVELMARNQYERYHYEAEGSYVYSEQTNRNKNAGYNGFQALDGNGSLKQLQEENGWKSKPVPGMGKSKTSEIEAPNKRNTSGCFPPMTSFHANMGGKEGSSSFSGLSAFSKSQKMKSGVQISDSGSIRSNNPQNSKRKGNNLPNGYSPSRVPIVEALNSSQQRVSGWDDRMEQVGPSRMPSRKPFSLDSPDKRITKISIFDKQARYQPASEARGGHVDINFMNPNQITLGKERQLGSESFRRASAQNQFVDRHRGIDLNANVSGSMDLHTNEAIPAMQLLSLMDAGMRSSPTAFSIDGNSKYFKKPFLPCDHHPKASPSGTSKVLDKPLFPYDHQFKEFNVRGGTMVFGDSSKNQLPSFHGKNVTSEKGCECSPPGGSLSSLFRAPSNPQEQSKAVVQNSFGKSRKYAAAGKTGVSQTSHSKMTQDKQKGIHISPGTLVLPCQHTKAKDSNKVINLETSSANGTAFGEGWVSRNDICSVNRNPADFSIPGPKNIYMINGKDLRFGKRPRGRPRLHHSLDGRKQQSAATLTDMKGKSQILSL